EVTGTGDGGHGVPPAASGQVSDPEGPRTCRGVEPQPSGLVASQHVGACVPDHVPGRGERGHRVPPPGGGQTTSTETTGAVAGVEPQLPCLAPGQDVAPAVTVDVTGGDDRGHGLPPAAHRPAGQEPAGAVARVEPQPAGAVTGDQVAAPV